MIGKQPSRKVQSVETAFRIVQHLQNLDGATTNELSNHLDIAKSTVHNYLQTMKSLGYVVENNGRNRLGLRFLTHGMAARNGLAIRDIVLHELEAAATELEMPVWWVVEEYGRGVFADKRTPHDETANYGRVGKRSFLHAHAPGKAILANLSQDRLSQILNYHGLPEYTEETITETDKLLAELEEIRDHGYAVDDGEVANGVQSIGVAFDGPYGYTHGIGAFGYSHDFTGSHARKIYPILQKTVQRIRQANRGGGK